MRDPGACGSIGTPRILGHTNKLSWRDRCRAVGDRLLASPRFQQLATAFPLTRPVARRRTRALFDLCAGFVYSQILLACVRLRLCEILMEGPQTVAGLSARLSLSNDATARLLSAAAALRLAEHRDRDRFGIGPLGAALAGNPAIGALVEHHSLLYGDLAEPVSLLRGSNRDTVLSGYWPYARAEQPRALAADEVAGYSALMAASQSLIATEILAAYPLARHRRLLDVGGGDGRFALAATSAWPDLQVMVFDLPAVAERANERFSSAGVSVRATACGGDFFIDPLPAGADLISLVRVLHDHDDEHALKLLRAVRRVLPADGTLLLAEPMAGPSTAAPIGAYFGFYLLAMGSGRPRTVEEVRDLLCQAGFTRVKAIRTRQPLLVSLIAAECNDR